LVRDGERAKCYSTWLAQSLAHGFQLEIPAVSALPSKRKACASRKPRIRTSDAAARRWVRLVWLALEDGRQRPLERIWRPRPRRSRRLAWSDDRPRSIGNGPLSRDERREMAVTLRTLKRSGMETTMPSTWGECQERDDPFCPFVGCKFHLYLYIDQASGAVIVNFPGKEPWELEQTCALKVVQDNPNGMELEAIAALMNVTDAVVQRMEARSRGDLKTKLPDDD
jgi:hypothetical protein